jgi:hypothetical protein
VRLEHLTAVIEEAQIDLYEGKPQAAWDRMESARAAFRRSGLLLRDFVEAIDERVDRNGLPERSFERRLLEELGERLVEAQQREQGTGFFGGASGLAVEDGRRLDRVSTDCFSEGLERQVLRPFGVEHSCR